MRFNEDLQIYITSLFPKILIDFSISRFRKNCSQRLFFSRPWDIVAYTYTNFHFHEINYFKYDLACVSSSAHSSANNNTDNNHNTYNYNTTTTYNTTTKVIRNYSNNKHHNKINNNTESIWTIYNTENACATKCHNRNDNTYTNINITFNFKQQRDDSESSNHDNNICFASCNNNNNNNSVDKSYKCPIKFSSRKL